MSLAGGHDEAGDGERPLARFEQRAGARRNRFELHVDRVCCEASDLLGSRRVSLPLDTLSPHVVVRRRGPRRALLGGLAGAAAAPFLTQAGWAASLAALALGGLAWLAGRRECIVFPGQPADLELFRDRPDAASARRFVAQVVRRIEALQQERAAEQRRLAGEQDFDRVGELIAFRALSADGIIDRAEPRVAAEALARQEPGRMGFR